MPCGPLATFVALEIKKPAAPYSRTDEFRTTLGEEALDFRVRNGNGYDSLSMATGKSRELGAKEKCNAGAIDPTYSEEIELSRPSD